MELDWIAIVVAVGSLIASSVSIYINLKKTPHENAKTDAETEKEKAETSSIHQQVADPWAEHVVQLSNKVESLEDAHEKDRKEIAGLRIDIAQVRRENEEYRRENADLRDWATRLVVQVKQHAPDIEPEKYIRRYINQE